MRNRQAGVDAIGPYRIVARAQEGLRGVHALDGHEVVIRVFSAAMAPRVARTIHVFGSLDHPGVVPVVESGVLQDGRCWLATERPAGTVLHDLLVNQTLRPDRVATLVRDVAEVLRFVHARGQVHGALRPHGIALIDREYSVSVGDWGQLLEGRRTKTVYDPADADADGRAADIYALGVIAFRALTGRFPQGLTMNVPAAPPALAKLIVQMLAPSAEARPTAKGVRDAVRAMFGEPVIADAIEVAIEDTLEELDPIDPIPPPPPRFRRPRWTPATHLPAIPPSSPAGSVMVEQRDDDDWE